jgi:hypothetical protein
LFSKSILFVTFVGDGDAGGDGCEEGIDVKGRDLPDKQKSLTGW